MLIFNHDEGLAADLDPKDESKGFIDSSFYERIRQLVDKVISEYDKTPVEGYSYVIKQDELLIQDKEGVPVEALELRSPSQTFVTLSKYLKEIYNFYFGKEWEGYSMPDIILIHIDGYCDEVFQQAGGVFHTFFPKRCISTYTYNL